MLKMEYLDHFSSPKSLLLKFFLNLFIRFFWNYTWWKPLKINQSAFLPKLTQNQYFRTFLVICSLDFSQIVPGDRQQKVGKSDYFGFLRRIHTMLKMEYLDHFLAPNPYVWSFLILFIRFFWNYIWWKALKTFSFRVQPISAQFCFHFT